MELLYSQEKSLYNSSFTSILFFFLLLFSVPFSPQIKYTENTDIFEIPTHEGFSNNEERFSVLQRIDLFFLF